MQVGNIEIVWPGWFWAIPTLCVLVVLPSVLLFLVFKYSRMPAWRKALLVPACVLGPLFATSLWPLIISLSGLVRVGGATASRRADWRTTADLFGDYGVYLWTVVTCFVVYAIYMRTRVRHQRLEGLLEGVGEPRRSDTPTDRGSWQRPEAPSSRSDASPSELSGDMLPLPEWLEEKATDAPTMVRVLVDTIDLRLRREYTRIRSCAEWHRFREIGTIAGCVALSLRLHVDVPQAYRTPLELAMRKSLDIGFPGSETLYQDCVGSVREALLEVDRSKRAAATFVLVSMWVLDMLNSDGSLTSDPQLVAELAQLYQNESHSYWTSGEPG